MMDYKKWGVLLLVLVMVCAFAVGCDVDTVDDDPDTGETPLDTDNGEEVDDTEAPVEDEEDDALYD